MKVNLQHTVDLEDVPEELAELLSRRSEKIFENIRVRRFDISASLRAGKVNKAKAEMETLRLELFNYDALHQEVISMIEGYQKLLAEHTLTENNTEEENEQSSETNESGESGDEVQSD